MLDSLKSTAEAEEATGFNPSGSTSFLDGGVHGPDASAPDTSAESRETDITILSNDMSNISIGDGHSATAVEDLQGIEQLDSESKARLLKDIFPSLSDYTISHALNKHNSSWRPTLDDLLNQVYLCEHGAKGIEAFSEDNTARRARKGKKRKNLRLDGDDLRSTSLPPNSRDSQNTANKWKTASEDVDFIASHVNSTLR